MDGWCAMVRCDCTVARLELHSTLPEGQGGVGDGLVEPRDANVKQDAGEDAAAKAAAAAPARMNSTFKHLYIAESCPTVMWPTLIHLGQLKAANVCCGLVQLH